MHFKWTCFVRKEYPYSWVLIFSLLMAFFCTSISNFYVTIIKLHKSIEMYLTVDWPTIAMVVCIWYVFENSRWMYTLFMFSIQMNMLLYVAFVGARFDVHSFLYHHTPNDNRAFSTVHVIVTEMFLSRRLVANMWITCTRINTHTSRL